VAQLKNRSKPVLVLSVGGTYSDEKRKELETNGISTFQEPLAAAKALQSLLKH
jgi:acyl-CoA synthetase (NDP forming)